MWHASRFHFVFSPLFTADDFVHPISYEEFRWMAQAGDKKGTSDSARKKTEILIILWYEVDLRLLFDYCEHILLLFLLSLHVTT